MVLYSLTHGREECLTGFVRRYPAPAEVTFVCMDDGGRRKGERGEGGGFHVLEDFFLFIFLVPFWFVVLFAPQFPKCPCGTQQIESR